MSAPTCGCLKKFIWILVAIALTVGAGPLDAKTPAATRIENWAEASYFWRGESFSTKSNGVTVTVLQVAGVEIGPHHEGELPGSAGFVPAIVRQAPPGERIYLPYWILNTGNGIDTFQLSVGIDERDVQLPPALDDVVIVHDIEGNGVVDAHDPQISSITLAADARAELWVSARLAQTVVDGEGVWLSLGAASHFDPGATAQSWSLVRVTMQGPVVSVARALSPMNATADQSDRLTHTVVIENSGYDQTDLILWEPIARSEQLDRDAYGPGLSLLIDGTPTSLGEGAAARLVDDGEGGLVLEIEFDAVAPAQQVTVEYQTLADWGPDDDEIRKTAVARYEYPPGEQREVRSNEILVRKGRAFSLHLHPSHQVKKESYAGHTVRFELTVTNSDRKEGEVLLRAAAPPPKGWTLAFSHVDGVTPLTPAGGPDDDAYSLGTLRPDDSRDFLVVITVPDDVEEPMTPPDPFEILAYFAEAPHIFQSATVAIGLVLPVAHMWDPLCMTVTPDNVVLPGTVLNYDLIMGNASDLDATNVMVVQELSPFQVPPDPKDLTWEMLPLPSLFGGIGSAQEPTACADETPTPVVFLWAASASATPAWVASASMTPASAASASATPAWASAPAAPASVAPAGAPDPTALAPEPPEAISPAPAWFGAFSLLADDAVKGEYDPVRHVIEWKIPLFPANFGAKLSFRTVVREETPEGVLIEVYGVLTSDASMAVAVSNVVTNVVLTKELVVDLTVDRPVATVGDTVTYTVDVSHLNPLAVLEDVQLIVDLAPGLTYREGSSTQNGVAIGDPTRHGNRLVYVISQLEKGHKARITLETLVNAAAEYELNVRAHAAVEKEADEWIISPEASVRLLIVSGILGDNGVILGRLLLGGTEESEPPVGVRGVRVYLDNGRFAVSDEHGLFSFTSVRPGPRLLRVDPTTLADVDLASGGVDPDQRIQERVIVPRGGIAMVDLILSPSEIEVTTSERLIQVDEP